MIGGTVLVVEHETPVRAYLEQQLADDGFEVLATDRATAAFELVEQARPSARGDAVDRVRGFARGCDDYVVRPFVYDELVARMRAVLRRTSGPRHARLSVRDLEIDLAARIVTVGGEPVQLSAKEYELLVALAEDPERVFKKEDLLRDVWGFRSLGRTRTLDSHASRLRRKLNRGGDAGYVLNVWGVGYRLTALS
jgi:DNA-binding response OmpR family regulator